MKKYTVDEFLLTYVSWQALLQRAHYRGKSRKDAKTYAGVRLDSRWLKFENFLEDMGPRSSRDLTLDRFPNGSGSYEKSNCRWASKRDQATNRRSTVLLSFQGESLSIMEWSRRTGIGRSTLQARRKAGWPVEEILQVQPDQQNAAHRSFAAGRAHGKKLSAEDVANVVRLARSGQTATSIAREFQVSPVAICHVLRQFNIKLKKGRPRSC